MSNNPIQLAYQAKEYVPSQDYRDGQRRKMYNPIRTTPALVQAMTHLGERGLTLAEARRRAKHAVQEPQAEAYIDDLDWVGLLDFLDTITVFLKTGPQKRKEQGMRKFNPQEKSESLSRQKIGETAIELAEGIPKWENFKDPNLNKLKKLGAHISASRDEWEALTGLARFYPRSGIPQKYIDTLVKLLETTEIHSFKQVVAQSLIFYEANLIRSRKERK